MDTKLNRLRHMISTQICVLVDCSRINRSIYYPSVLQIYRDSTQLTSHDCKNEPIHTISYKLHQDMPCSNLFSTDSIRVIIALLVAQLSFFDFSNLCHGQYYFPCEASKLYFLQFKCAQWLSCALVTYILSQDLGASPERRQHYSC